MEQSPKEIVQELDKYIIGQQEAKKAVAIALRNRYRRSALPKELREEITPKNIIMKGPTGVGKTEIARRIAKLVKAPFVKVEATKFTEVGYVGRDVESMIRDLVEASIRLVKQEKIELVKARAEKEVDAVLMQALFVAKKLEYVDLTDEQIKEKLHQEYKEGKHESTTIEIEIAEAPKQMQMMPGMGMEINIGEMLGGILPKRKIRKRFAVEDARKVLMQEACDKLIDNETVQVEGLRRAEQDGIIFIDEIDKIIAKSGGNGPDVSREGVQRDILPIVEGSTVTTKYGPIKTDYILFIAAGAFSASSVQDLIPELQGRFPIVVELKSLNAQDFKEILTSTENSLLVQYEKLLEVDNVHIVFEADAVEHIAQIAQLQNTTSENIGARRLHNLMEAVLEDISFNATGEHPMVNVVIDKEYVQAHLKEMLNAYDLKKYIL